MKPLSHSVHLEKKVKILGDFRMIHKAPFTIAAFCLRAMYFYDGRKDTKCENNDQFYGNKNIKILGNETAKFTIDVQLT